MSFRVLACLAAAAGAAGCSSLTVSPTQVVAVTVQSGDGRPLEKVGCEARNDKGAWIFEAPGNLSVRRSSEDLVMDCKKDGHPPGRLQVISRAHAGLFGNAVFGGLVGAAIDHHSGTAYDYPDILPVKMGANLAVVLEYRDNASPVVAITPVAPDPAPQAATPSVPPELPRVAAAADAGNSGLPASLPRVGDLWKYRYVDGYNRDNNRIYVHEATAVAPGSIQERMYVVGKAETVDRHTFTPQAQVAQRSIPGELRLEFAPFLQVFAPRKLDADIGKVELPSDTTNRWDALGRIVGRETITVGAGSFEAVKVEVLATRAPLQFHPMLGGEAVRLQHLIWYAPKAKRYVRYQVTAWDTRNSPVLLDSYELVELKLN